MGRGAQNYEHTGRLAFWVTVSWQMAEPLGDGPITPQEDTDPALQMAPSVGLW